MLLEPRLPWLVACEDGVVGYAYASHHRPRAAYRWSVDVSVYLAPSAQGQGTGSALYAGFKHGQWVDVGWWRRPLIPRPEVPSEPKPCG